MSSNGMEGWTSAGLSTQASELLEEMGETLHMNKREAATIAILWFAKSQQYKDAQEKVQKIHELKAQIASLEESFPSLTKFVD